MFVPYTWTTCLLGLVSAGLIFWLVRRNLMHASYAMWWTAVGFVIVLGGLFPAILDRIGVALGVSYPPILFVVLGFLALTLRLVLGDIERTRMDLQLRRMAQKVAQLQHRLIRLEEAFSPLSGKEVSRSGNRKKGGMQDKRSGDGTPPLS